MKVLTRSLAMLCFMCSHALFSQTVFINEFLASNSTGITDDFGENDDWVELFNPGTVPVDIGGWYATDDLDEATKWQIPTSDPAATSIPAGGFLLLWFDKDPGQGPLHINAKLSADGEAIGLFAADGTSQIDSLSFGPQTADVSFGRTADGSPGFQFFQTPTPNSSNGGSPGADFAEAPIASVPGGFFQNNFQIELTSASPNADIRFTLDGSEPTELSALYSAPLEVDSTTTLRARAFVIGELPSPVTTHTYLFGGEHKFPVVALSFAEADFFDPLTGIYPNWEEDWERPVHVEFFEADRSLAFGQKATVEIHGSGSASQVQKSLKLKAVADAGSGFFEHGLFPDLPFGKYKKFLLRNSGQDFNITQFRDGMVASLTSDLSDVDSIIEPPRLFQQAFRPGVLYLNGEYWGIQNVREHLSSNYLEQHFGLDANDLDFLDNDDPKEGDLNQWGDLMSYIETHHFGLDDEMETLESMVDMPHWLDYMACNIIIDNADWPGNNFRRWKKRDGDSQWRFITFDLDFSFGLFTHVPGAPPIWNEGDASPNSLARSLDSISTGWPNPWWNTFLFRRTMENPQFRTDFANRTADLLNVLFEAQRVNQRIDDFEALYLPEYERHFERWIQSPDVWPANVELLRKFADERPAHVRQHFVEVLDEVTGTAVLTLKTEPPEAGQIKLSTLDLPPEKLPWSGGYFTGIDIPVEAVAASGFVFVGWSEAGLGASPSAKIRLEGDLELTAIFQTDTGGPLAQTIDFQPIADKLIDDVPFQILAEASSGLSVEFEILAGPATVFGSEITLTGEEGIVVVSAAQPGNSDWLPATPVLRNFTVSEPAPPTPPVGYCEVTTDFPWHEWIERVEFGSIDHLSFKSQYSDFTDVATEAAIGGSFMLTITPAFSWEIWEENFRAWIDFNQDADFDDPGEMVMEATGTEAVSADVNIPPDALPGPTRMRIAMHREQWPEACEPYVFGEMEDYSVVLSIDGFHLPPSGGEDEIFKLNLFPNPVNERLAVQFFTKEKGPVGLTIVSPLGVEVFQEKMKLQEGGHYVEMDVSKLKSGAYTLLVNAEGMKRRAVQFVRAEM